MPAGTLKPPAVFPKELRICIQSEGCTLDELARRLLARHSSLTSHRLLPDSFPNDHGWLVDAIQRLLALQSADEPWPLSIPAGEFIPAVAKCLPRVFLAEWRLTVAAALDTLRANDPASGNPSGSGP
jgi:hypothetical protein